MGTEVTEIIKAISYAPVPLKEVQYLPNDDFMAKGTQNLWSSASCRRDLSLMKAMGANAVRLYGDDAELDHQAFLDEALNEGLKVIPGLSDYAYIQMEGSCMSTNFDCFTQIQKQYTSNLRNGFMHNDGTYHAALEMIVLMNEPDLKFEMQHGTANFCKAVISALDAILEAEVVAGVVGKLPKFAIVVSFAMCQTCSSFQNNPGLGQMDELRRAFHEPQLVGYTPKHDIWDAYQTRVVNGINTANSVSEFLQYFMESYTATFPQTPLFVGEFHSPTGRMQEELTTILQVAQTDRFLLGVSFFEFQVRYDKGPKDQVYGMFGLGNVAQGSVQIAGQDFLAWCLTPQADTAGNMLPQAVAAAFGGAGVDYESLCTRTCPASTSIEQKYDCDKDFEHWGMMWSPLQQDYCCTHGGRGCSGDKPPIKGTTKVTTTGCAPEATTPSTTGCATQATTLSTTMTSTTVTVLTTTTFACHDGLQDENGKWSSEKREWCCLKLHLGCPRTTTTTTKATTRAPDITDCEQDYGTWATTWSEKKVKWCCTHEQRGCSDKTAMMEATTGAYNCSDGFTRWAEEWPAGKQAWCCLNERIACRSDVTADGFVKTSSVSTK